MATDSSLWVNNGGNLSSAPLSSFLRKSAQPLYKFRQFADAKEGFGKGNGDTFNWSKVSNVAAVGGELTETSTVPLTSQTITKGTLVVKEYGQGIAFTGKVEALSKFDIEEMIEKGLRDDMAGSLDAAVERQFNATLLRHVGTATDGHVLTVDGTATATNTSVLNEYHLRKMVLELEKRNVPMIGGSYIGIFALEAIEGLQGAMTSIDQYTEAGYKKILNGEVGTVRNVRIIKDNNATRNIYDLAAKTKTADTWTGEKSLNGYVFGQDTVTECVVVPEQVRVKELTDFQRSKGLCWYFLGGWKITWDTAADQRIIKWDSNA